MANREFKGENRPMHAPDRARLGVLLSKALRGASREGALSPRLFAARCHRKEKAMNLTTKQRIVAFASVILVIAAVFPPWVYTFDRTGSHSRSSAGYGFILWPPKPKDTGPFFGVEIDGARLAVEWACILVAAGAVWFCFGNISASEGQSLTAGIAITFRRWIKVGLIWTGIGVLLGIAVFAAITIGEALNASDARQKNLRAGAVAPSQQNSQQGLYPDIPGSFVVLSDDQFNAVRTNAANGQADAQAFLGWSYFYGVGVIKDYVQAAKWYRMAANQGNAYGECGLGLCCENGFGVQRDLVAGYKWLNLAAAQKQKEAIASLASLDKAMTPEQIADGQRLSREFIPFIPDPPILFTPDPPPGFVSATNAPATKLDLQPLVEPPAAATNAAKAPSATQFLNDAVPSNKAAGHGFDPSLLTPITTNGQK
jgi:hypothetical protein